MMFRWLFCLVALCVGGIAQADDVCKKTGTLTYSVYKTNDIYAQCAGFSKEECTFETNFAYGKETYKLTCRKKVREVDTASIQQKETQSIHGAIIIGEDLNRCGLTLRGLESELKKKYPTLHTKRKKPVQETKPRVQYFELNDSTLKSRSGNMQYALEKGTRLPRDICLPRYRVGSKGLVPGTVVLHVQCGKPKSLQSQCLPHPSKGQVEVITGNASQIKRELNNVMTDLIFAEKAIVDIQESAYQRCQKSGSISQNDLFFYWAQAFTKEEWEQCSGDGLVPPLDSVSTKWLTNAVRAQRLQSVPKEQVQKQVVESRDTGGNYTTIYPSQIIQALSNENKRLLCIQSVQKEIQSLQQQFSSVKQSCKSIDETSLSKLLRDSTKQDKELSKLYASMLKEYPEECRSSATEWKSYRALSLQTTMDLELFELPPLCADPSQVKTHTAQLQRYQKELVDDISLAQCQNIQRRNIAPLKKQMKGMNLVGQFAQEKERLKKNQTLIREFTVQQNKRYNTLEKESVAAKAREEEAKQEALAQTKTVEVVQPTETTVVQEKAPEKVSDEVINVQPSATSEPPQGPVIPAFVKSPFFMKTGVGLLFVGVASSGVWAIQEETGVGLKILSISSFGFATASIIAGMTVEEEPLRSKISDLKRKDNNVQEAETQN